MADNKKSKNRLGRVSRSGDTQIFLRGLMEKTKSKATSTLNQDPNEKDAFTIDGEKTGSDLSVPGVTKLLNRKKLNLSSNKEAKPQERPKEPPAPPTPPAPPLETAPVDLTHSMIIEQRVAHSFTAPAAKIQPVLRRSQAVPAKALNFWSEKTLKSGIDPLARGLSSLLGKGVKGGLFLAPTKPPAGSPVPHFVASAYFGGKDRLSVWSGLRWDPAIVPEIWNHFVKAGFIDLPPPGTTTNQLSTRNLLRGAFAIQSQEWLTLIRVGPPNSCRGVLALLSDKTLANELQASLALIQAPFTPKK